MSESKRIELPWEGKEKVESKPVETGEAVEVKESDEPQFNGIKKTGEVWGVGDGTVLAVPVSDSVRTAQLVMVAARDGCYFVCCNIRQKTSGYTTRMVCGNCGTVIQLTMTKTRDRVQIKKPLYQWVPDEEVELVEDHVETMTGLGVRIKKGTKTIIKSDFGVLPMDRYHEVMVLYKPTKEEWGEGGEPKEILFPVPAVKLRRVQRARTVPTTKHK